jgi:antitoxin component YwqK of YwqJK toxin-antitoxin module
MIIMKRLKVLGIFILMTIGLYAQNIDFKHEWEMKYLEDGTIQFTSKRKAPIPFSTTGEPQALLYYSATKLDPKSGIDLHQIVKDEIEGIRNSINIDEYLENDYKPVDGIVTRFEKLDNVEIAIIKYRTNGKKEGERTMPRSVKHVLFVKDNLYYNSTLIVLFAEDQDNIRKDQMTFVKDIINHKKK